MNFSKPIHLKFLALLVPILLLCACAGISTSGGGFGLESDPVMIKSPPLQSTALNEDAYNFLVAEFALNRNQPTLAAERYLHLLASQENPELAERALQIALYSGDFDLAVQAARRWVEIEPMRIEAHQAVVVAYIRQDQPESAVDYLDSLIRNNDIDTRQLFVSLIVTLASEVNVEAVLSVTRNIADKYPQQAYVLYLHGVLSGQQQASEEALDYIDRALEIEEIDAAHSVRAQLLFKLGRDKAALTSFEKALRYTPDDRSLRMSYARLLISIKRYEQAYTEFKSLHARYPNSPDLIYTLGLLSLEFGEVAEAEGHFLELITLNERKGDARFYLGYINEQRQDYDAAVRWYQDIDESQYRLEAKLRLAKLYGLLGRYAEAHAQLQLLLADKLPEALTVSTYLTKARIFQLEKKYHQAMATYNIALAIAPRNTDLLYARALNAEKIGQLEVLEADLKVILEVDPNNARALNALGFTLADKTKRYAEAFQLIRRAIEITPDDAAVIDSLGWIHYRLGRYDEAIRLLRRALSRYNDSEIAAHLGEVLWVAGQQEEARKVWKNALKKSPNAPLVEDTMRRLLP